MPTMVHRRRLHIRENKSVSGAASSKDLENLKLVLRAVVKSSRRTMDVRLLRSDYKYLLGQPLPAARYGYRDTVQFLRECCADCFSFHGPRANPILELKVPDSNKHIEQNVHSQKSSKLVPEVAVDGGAEPPAGGAGAADGEPAAQSLEQQAAASEPEEMLRLKRASAAYRALLDADDALPGIDYAPDVFPADCLGLLDTIPTASVAGVQPGNMLGVLVAEVYSPSHLWLQRLGADFDSMKECMVQMWEYYSKGEGEKRVLAAGARRPGQYCSSLIEGDWHRSVIVQVLDSDTVKVRCVDSGTVATVDARSLRPLRREWGALPAQAVRAQLAGLEPAVAGGPWPPSAAAHLLGLVRGRGLVANVITVGDEENILEVFLIDTSTEEDVNITDLMICDGHADTRLVPALGTLEPYLQPAFSALESGAVDWQKYVAPPPVVRDAVGRADMAALADLTHKVNSTRYPIGSAHWVNITHLTDPSDFYVRPIAYKDYLPMLKKRDGPVDPAMLSVGSTVIFKPTTKNHHIRGQISDIKTENDTNVCSVFALDYGFVESSVPAENLKKPAIDFSEPLVLNCQLENSQAKKGNFSRETIEAMSYYVGSDRMKMVIQGVDGDKYTVQLISTRRRDNPTTLALAGFSRMPSPEQPKPYFTYKKVNVGDKLKVKIQFKDSFEKFYVCELEDYKRYIKEQNNNRFVYHKEPCFSADDLQRGNAVAVYSERLRMYERAVITDVVTPGEKAVVQLVDWGTKMDVDMSASKLKVLSKEHYFVRPAIAIYCKLDEQQYWDTELHRYMDPGLDVVLTVKELGYQLDWPHTVTITKTRQMRSKYCNRTKCI